MAEISKMFNAYSEHLKLVRELKITEREDEYICPICLRGYKKSEINQLSLEDVPQAALGGKKIAITCRRCNNTCGNTIDHHLINYIDSLENKNFLLGSNRKIKIINLGEGKPIEGSLMVLDSKNMKMLIPENYFKSPDFEKRLRTLSKGEEITLQNRGIKTEKSSVSAAILKNAYLILFSKFGYSFLLDDHYNTLRNQIQSHSTSLSPYKIWRKFEKSPTIDGIYFSCDNRYLGFFVVYTITRKQSYQITVYIPTPSVHLYSALNTIKNEATNGEGLSLTTFDTSNLLWDKGKIQSIRDWVYTKS